MAVNACETAGLGGHRPGPGGARRERVAVVLTRLTGAETPALIFMSTIMIASTRGSQIVAHDTHDRGRPVRLPLPAGYLLAGEDHDIGGTLHLHAPDGTLCLTLHLDAAGPRLEVAAHSVAIVAEKNLQMRCEDLEITAQHSISMIAGGVISTEGFAQVMRARTGDIELKANDDVRVDGERIYLNSPYTQPTPDERRMSLIARRSPPSDAR